ncbi:MAG TPA: zinc metalloprotease HtpX [Bacillota bacterium]|jgi:heat shock protein HtpX|nr:zinc metalloprotease HtpX [Peptococcaceae bacterium MAG4]NLW38076.1 zinc metalloprotease HtpX [Peptococcaceae bacterium]HPZ44192.1 zinc metalloprotease HtpX [Bacillota bacterium]HQD76731.1 zinc metalloprotease HtpX [Bacillota bacterium]HUM57926.1 zinc metalloprotease HtpX [Bacillota bacterium]
MNNLKVFLLMGLLSVILVLIGSAVGGQSGAILFFLISLAMNFFTYYFSDKVAISMTRSQPVSEREAPELYSIVRRLAQRAGLPMPRLYVTPSPQPNAFATGRNPANSAVAVTEGLLQLLNRTELEGVLAHELAHIKNRDVLVGTIAAAFAGAITMLANIIQWGAILGMGRDDEEGGAGALGALLLAIIAPIAAMIIQMAISRSREYGADETGARIAGNTQGLASALLKLESAAHRIPMQVNPAASHLFIVNPLSGQSVARLFSTHPPIADRVERLKKMRV